MSDRKQKKPSAIRRQFPKRMQRKLVLLFIIIVLAFVFLIVKATYINATNGEKYTKIVLDQQQYNSRTIAFKRGDILDRNGTVVATSKRVYKVILDEHLMLAAKDDKTMKSDKKEQILAETESQVKEVLELCFGIDSTEVDKLLETEEKSYYNVMKSGVDYVEAQKFNEMRADSDKYPYIGCIWLEEGYVRNYPYSTLAADVIGFTVDGNIGNAGIEASYNSILNGTDGREYGYFDKDASMEKTVKNAVNGSNIVSTIDITLQSIVEKHIVAFNEENANVARSGEGSKNTAVLIMNPNTGEILAEASYPNFDLNNPRDLSKYYSEETLAKMTSEELLDARNQLWRNFCVSDTYEPGSTVKPFTIAAALEDGTISGNEAYYCGGSKVVVNGTKPISCHKRDGHGMQTISDGIANSCNVVMMDVSAILGRDAFCRYQNVFGFGQRTGIDLPGEAETAGLIYKADNMGPVELATNSFGQGFNVTMTQMAAAFSSIINGGNYYEPHIVKQIRDENGNVIENKSPVLLRKTVSEETSNMLKKYMVQTMTDGTGKNAQVEGYSMGGKTGTAEKLPRGNGNYLLSFMGFAPVDNPEILVYVIIDEPNAEKQSVSAYVTELARNIMEEAFPYLNITKTETVSE